MQPIDELKQRFPLLDYLRSTNWEARAAGSGAELVGLCPLHRETRPSFYVNPRKNLFYCHGCGRGGDLIRFLQLSRGLSFGQSIAWLAQPISGADNSDLLSSAAAFYRSQLHHHGEAIDYLLQRGVRNSALIQDLGIGYAPGGNLRTHLASRGYTFQAMLDSGLLNAQGRDTLYRRVIFPCRQGGRIVNLYGRSLSAEGGGAVVPHRLLAASKGSLFAWDAVRRCSAVILVEGLFDLAVLWQAGFPNTTSALGAHLTSLQFQQLCDVPGRAVSIVFDEDENQAGQQAARQLAQRLKSAGMAARIGHLPAGHDPASYFLAGATGRDFAACLERAETL